MRRLDTWKPRNPVAVVYASPRRWSTVNGRTPPFSGPIRSTTRSFSGRRDDEEARVPRAEVDELAVGRDDRVVRARRGMDLVRHLARTRRDDVPDVVFASLALRHEQRPAVP